MTEKELEQLKNLWQEIKNAELQIEALKNLQEKAKQRVDLGRVIIAISHVELEVPTEQIIPLIDYLKKLFSDRLQRLLHEMNTMEINPSPETIDLNALW